jgi:hypothetical protein
VNFLKIKIAVYLSLASIQDVQQEKPSALKREHPSLQNMKFLNLFLFLWVIYAFSDPDSESGSGPTDMIESESPKHW